MFFLLNKLSEKGKARTQLIKEDMKACKNVKQINLKLYLL